MSEHQLDIVSQPNSLRPLPGILETGATPQDCMPTLRAAAGDYADDGFAVFPLRAGGKVPALSNWQQRASRDRATVSALWTRPDFNIGLPTGPVNGVVVVDVDDPVQWEALLAEQARVLPSGPRVRTRRGYHLYFSLPPGVAVRNRVKVAGCFDVRGDGGYVVLPPSLHPDGGQYEFIEPLEKELPVMPAWLRELIEGEPGAKAVSTIEQEFWAGPLGRECRALAAAQPGERNDQLNRSAFILGQLVAGGQLEEQDVRVRLEQAAAGCGLEVAEIQRTLDSGLRSGLGQPRGDCHHGACGEDRGVPDKTALHWDTPRPLSSALAPVEPFDPVMLPDSIWPFVHDIAERKDSAPVDFAAVGVVVALGSLIGRKLGIHPKRQDDWLVIPNLWGAVVGRPSMKKSPILEEAIGPLKRMESQARDEHEAAQKEHQVQEKLAQMQQKATEQEAAKLIKQNNLIEAEALLASLVAGMPELPARRRRIINNATVEKLGEILAENPMGVLLFRDELTGWLSSLEREDRGEDRAFYLEAWSGLGSFVYDRIGRGTVDIKSTTVSVLGGIQPGKLEPYLMAQRQGSGDDGFIERFQLLVYPDAGSFKHVDRRPDQAAKDRAFQVFERCHALPVPEGPIPALRFEDKAQALFDAWYMDLFERLRQEECRFVESHLSKYPSLMPSLALIFHVIEYGPEGAVGEEAAQRAAAWCEYLESHARRIYGLVSDPSRGARVLRDRLCKLPNPFRVGDFNRKQWAGLTNADEINIALAVLCEHGYLAEETVQTSTKPKRVFHINPAVLED